MTGPVSSIEPGAITFLPEEAIGMSEDEAYAFLNGGTVPSLVASAVPFVAAADIHDGAMVAFIATTDSIAELTLGLTNAEPLGELHVTAAYLGNAVEIDDDVKANIIEVMTELAQRQPLFTADIFGFGEFNPDSAERCLVALFSGDDLADAHDSVTDALDEVGIDVSEQHRPWIPHMTLWYGSDPRTQMTDELMNRTGPVIIDRIRVAFGGVVTDLPLSGGLVAATVFHLPGQHNQATHGRGGASPSELAAGEQLNAGKKLNANDPEHARLHGAINAWSNGGHEGAQVNAEIEAAPRNPGADTDGAMLSRVIAGAPANAPELHRGMIQVHPDDIPREGHVFALGPTSFTRSKKVMDVFSEHESHDYGRATTVHMHLAKGSHSLKIDHVVTGKYQDEQEHATLGRFRVTKRTERQQVVKTRSGGKKEITLYELHITQVDDGELVTFAQGGKSNVLGPGELHD